MEDHDDRIEEYEKEMKKMKQDYEERLRQSEDERMERSPQSPVTKKGIIKRRTMGGGNADGGSSPMRRVSIQVETAQHHSYSGIATV